MASTSLFTSISVPYLPSPSNQGHFSARFRPTHLFFPRHRLSLGLGLSTVASVRRRSTNSAAPKKKKKQQSSRKIRDKEDEEDDGDDMDKDEFDALFEQLGGDDDDDLGDLTEEDFLEVECLLADALVGGSDDDEEGEEDDEDEDEDDEDAEDEDEDEDEEEEVKLKNWQLRRLASALKVGRRKTSIKLLAAELCLDRAVVLEILRNPPPKLLLYSATLPDFKPTTAVTTVPEPVPVTVVEPRTKVNVPDPVPVHAKQSRWTAQKRMKKVQAQTLEQVYRRTKRPTNAMIDSIILVTKLPRQKILHWFEEKRAENGVVNKYPTPYRRSDKKTTFSQ